MLDRDLVTAGLIPWSSPVLSFGDISSSLVATIGLNPSNREFVDESGLELNGEQRRFHTLQSFGLDSWDDATEKHLELIAESCRAYFSQNPYDTWFRKLDRIIAGTGASYYQGSACHLDLIPYATSCKWTELRPRQKATLLDRGGDTLGLLLQHSPVRVLVLNGRSVVDEFQATCKIQLTQRQFPAWALPRRSEPDVPGLGYQGTVDSISGIALARQVLVLGFNHNIQSSFGVTSQVMKSIASWVSRSVENYSR